MIDNEIENRSKVIVRTSIVGIATNVVLSAFKAAIGFITGSIAVTLDAVNNLSDALSSVITIVGAKLANKLPDKKHPLGYGRIEYLSAMIVAAIVLYAGGTSAVESVKKIIHPEAADYSTISLVIIAAAVVVKLVLGKYVKSQGERVNSGALVASGADALFDAILSASVLASAIVFVTTGVSLEAYVGVLISLFIIKSGIEMLKDTLDDILGKRTDGDTAKEIKKILTSEKPVRGAYDLILNDYGPNKSIGSVHLELPDTMTVEELDVLTRKLQNRVYKETGILLAGVGVYSHNTKNDEAADIRNKVLHIVKSHEWALQMHGFYVDLQERSMRFDVVMSFAVAPEEGVATLIKEVSEAFPEYSVHIAPDVDLG
ncbi:cation diffusion facilitator family transporter [Fibrobacter sp. UBA3629]|uniref:cation diffusion facilitator family transporter n=1 Tax=Fibrobacter sp. UBA3629 TaxID=1946530 RepID=UPI0025BD1EA1|nr:cation diffusion facilitator family transporter [Fibrobacter sp. UBA3629]